MIKMAVSKTELDKVNFVKINSSGSGKGLNATGSFDRCIVSTVKKLARLCTIKYLYDENSVQNANRSTFSCLASGKVERHWRSFDVRIK